MVTEIQISLYVKKRERQLFVKKTFGSLFCQYDENENMFWVLVVFNCHNFF